MNLIKPTAVYILDHHWPKICIAGYQLLRRDRCGKAGGGVAIYVKDDLNCVRFIKYDVLILKLSGLKYVHSPSDCLLVVCTNLLTVLISLINFAVLWKKKWLSKKNVVITGDFNADQLSPNCNSSMLKRICQAFNCRNLITRPTRIAESSSTRLDLILTNNFPKIFYIWCSWL